MRKEEFYLQKDNGQKISVLAFIPENKDSNKKYPTVIFAHGYNGNYKGLMHHGEGFAENEIACIFFDFCGGGLESASDGSMLEMTIQTEVDDLLFVIQKVTEFSYVDSENLFLQGESMGGFVSAYVAAMVPQKIRSLVLWYPAFVIPDGAKARIDAGETTCFGIPLSPNFDKEAMEIDIYSIIGKYEGPVKIIHGDKDEVVPIEYSDRALKCYKNATMLTISGAGHGYNGEDSIAARNCSVDFIKENIFTQE